ncbi:cofactor assembly of complex C subunit B [Prochlorococcus marinus str. MU1404]|uniref:cofactor assembly of complex C subunit B n=1 Tax=Prochlorococcus marinus TaxID=1219 RepID=UPI001ADB9BFD|nr:cofactor assembly of complex C subunit B [Prochlorococcus marinus]MBO8230029.1 cofactor assembly of complex C subunit B [Prochlorococcus marinus XMU1404]MBW3073197.1 cofactor assembly of complex C subunit B [Prochlorococcus marinus str. MU1404]MCR8545634.1 cofactor assembly of complex C subunit B [Prochlorococcus marinus CUG1432]
MGFNGKSLIIIGTILFIFQIVNFFSIEIITPELERAQVLAAIASLIVILIGFLFKQFDPLAGVKTDLKGENKFLFDKNIPEEVIEELAWGSEAILTSTAAATILIHNDGVNILRRGITSRNKFTPGETCYRAIKDMKLISLANTKFYPGKDEFNNFCPEIPSILIVPINSKAFILIGGWSTKCFTKSDEKWINNWSKKINNVFSKNNI